MKEKPQIESVEAKIAQVDEWVEEFSEKILVPELDRSLLRSVLEECGADFDISPELLASLGKEIYTNASRRKAMEAIWGKKYEEFKNWIKKYIEDYEQTTGKELPVVKKYNSRNSGMIGFLVELTSFAAGSDQTYPFGTFFIRLSQRALNGHMRELGLTAKEDRFHLKVPGYNVIEYNFEGEGERKKGELPFSPAGFPGSFPQAAWEEIKSWR